jgi:hypothetical protein
MLKKPKQIKMKEKTAVEWFLSKLTSEIPPSQQEFNDYLKQALEFEKQDKHSEYMRGWKDGYSKQELKSE